MFSGWSPALLIASFKNKDRKSDSIDGYAGKHSCPAGREGQYVLGSQPWVLLLDPFSMLGTS